MATTATDTPESATATVAGRRSRVLSPLIGGALVGAATVGLHFRDPHVQGSWGICPTALLGFDCPACGSLRAVHHLTNLDLVAAASSNLLFVLVAPAIVLLWLRRMRGAWRGDSDPLTVPGGLWVAALVVLTVFTVVRNLPAGSWLHS